MNPETSQLSETASNSSLTLQGIDINSLSFFGTSNNLMNYTTPLSSSSGIVFLNTDGTNYTTTGSSTSNTNLFVYRNNNLVLDEKPLKYFLMKYFKWIKDVTQVTIRNLYNRTPSVDIHITVSPIHHTELMDDKIFKIVTSKINKKISHMLVGIYPEIKDESPNYIFLPEYSETILDLL